MHPKLHSFSCIYLIIRSFSMSTLLTFLWKYFFSFIKVECTNMDSWEAPKYCWLENERRINSLWPSNPKNPIAYSLEWREKKKKRNFKPFFGCQWLTFSSWPTRTCVENMQSPPARRKGGIDRTQQHYNCKPTHLSHYCLWIFFVSM